MSKNADTLHQLILDIEDEFFSSQKITLPPGLQEIASKSGEQVLLHLRAAFDILNQTSEKYLYYVLQNLSFLEQRQIYNDLSEYKIDYEKNSSEAFNSLKEKTKTYTQLQKYLVFHEFKKIHKKGKQNEKN